MTVELDELLEQNLSSYIEANADTSSSNFRVARELKIARYALEESLQLHAVVNRLVKNAIELLKDSKNEADLIKLITLANNLEERHNKLLQASKQVASIAKTGAEVESLLSSKLDAIQIYSILAQLPQLLQSMLNSILLSYFSGMTISNGKPLNINEVVSTLIERISEEFNEELERSVHVLTYKAESSSSVPDNGVIESQVVSMLNSVPTSSVVLRDSEVAETIRQHDNVIEADDA